MPKANPSRPPGPGRPPLAQDERANRQARFLNAAATVFAKRGYRETDVQEIADAVGVGKATLYRYFPTKFALFNATIEHGIIAMHAAIWTAMATAPTPLEKIRAGTRAYLTYWSTNPQLVELMAQQRAEFRGADSAQCLAHREQGKAEAGHLFRQLIDAGLMRDRPTELLADLLFDLLYGTMFFNTLLNRTKPIAQQADDLLDLFFQGTLTDQGRRLLAKSSTTRQRTAPQDSV